MQSASIVEAMPINSSSVIRSGIDGGTAPGLLFDSNVWIKEVGLMSKRASTLRLYMHECAGRLFLPEVVTVETERYLTERIRDSVEQAKKTHRQLLPLFGEYWEWNLPDDDTIAHRAAELARGVNLPVNYLALQGDTTLRAARRYISRRAPAHHRKKCGFKDCLLWEEVLNILDTNDLSFVTDDNDFYASPRCQELHPMLKAEVATKQGSLTILRDLETLLRPFRKEYDVPLNVVIAFVEPRAIPIKRAAESIGFEPSSEPVVSCQVFATSTPGTVEVWFVSVQPFHDTSEQARTTEGLRIDGRGLYDSRRRSCSKQVPSGCLVSSLGWVLTSNSRSSH